VSCCGAQLHSTAESPRAPQGQPCAHTLDQSHRLFDDSDGVVAGS
jgi:hypothetical protein